MNKSLEELRDDYIKELAEVEKKIEYTKTRLKYARRNILCAETYNLEKLLFVYEEEKTDLKYSIKRLNEYCD